MAGLTPRRIDYGPHPDQFGELTLPEAPLRGTVVVIHGGFWKQAYTLDLGRPLVADLAARGWACWNIEYRRVGRGGDGAVGGGGDPETFDDVAAALDVLAGLTDLPDAPVVALGHSAGGHLATWAAGRDRSGPKGARAVSAVIAQAGVLDLARARADGLGGGAVDGLTGGVAPSLRIDPTRRLPLEVPVWCVHGRADDIVPFAQSADYVDRARAAGGVAELLEVPGDHFAVIDPESPAWARTVAILDALAGAEPGV